MGVKSLVQGLNAAATAGFEPRTVACTTRVRKTEARTTPVRSQQCECQQCEGVNSANETRVRMSNVRMPLVRQECERQKCERHQCEANSANANSAKGSTVRMRQECECQMCECQQCDATSVRKKCDSSANANSANRIFFLFTDSDWIWTFLQKKKKTDSFCTVRRIVFRTAVAFALLTFAPLSHSHCWHSHG